MLMLIQIHRYINTISMRRAHRCLPWSLPVTTSTYQSCLNHVKAVDFFTKYVMWNVRFKRMGLDKLFPEAYRLHSYKGNRRWILWKWRRNVHQIKIKKKHGFLLPDSICAVFSCSKTMALLVLLYNSNGLFYENKKYICDVIWQIRPWKNLHIFNFVWFFVRNPFFGFRAKFWFSDFGSHLSVRITYTQNHCFNQNINNWKNIGSFPYTLIQTKLLNRLKEIYVYLWWCNLWSAVGYAQVCISLRDSTRLYWYFLFDKVIHQNS